MMKNMFMMVVAGVMVAGSAFAGVASDESCAVDYVGVESFATCVDGKLFARPYAEGKSAVELGYVGAEALEGYADVVPAAPAAVKGVDVMRKEACGAGYVGAAEMYGCD